MQRLVFSRCAINIYFHKWISYVDAVLGVQVGRGWRVTVIRAKLTSQPCRSMAITAIDRNGSIRGKDVDNR